MPDNYSHPIVNIPTGKLNNTDDAAIGGPANSLTGQPFYRGQLGARLLLSHEDAAKASLTSTGTLYGGMYQYVQTKSASSAAPARGLVAFWDDELNFVVTPDAPAGTGCVAGIYINAPTKGNYCWIQKSGLASVKYATPITKATPAAQDMVYVKDATNVLQVEEDATQVTNAMLRRLVGTANETPVADAIRKVSLWERHTNV